MSVASEFPPEVHIPARARRGAVSDRWLAAVPSGALPADPRLDLSVPGVDERVARLRVVSLAPVGLRRHPAAPARLCAEELIRPPAPLRLTRRGSVALAVVGVIAAGLFLLIAHLSLALAPHSGAAASGPAPSTVLANPSGVVVVHDGDTLWSIAQRVNPLADPRSVVDQLQRANHLSTVNLVPGQTLKLH